MSLRAAFGFTMVEALVSRLFDFAVLWIVLFSLPAPDLAKFGLATASVVFFNVVFFVPETALLRFKAQWEKDGVLDTHLSAFLQFSLWKIALHLALCAAVASVKGPGHWLSYAVVFSLITQQIQLAEIVRIFLRMDLCQSRVAKVEMITKLVLFLLCLNVLWGQSLTLYFAIFWGWSLAVAAYWVATLVRSRCIVWLRPRQTLRMVLGSMTGFSLWSQLSGNLSYFIYNSSILFLGLAGAKTEDLALFTVINRVTNLFFVASMMLAGFVPIVLANAGVRKHIVFGKLLWGSAGIALTQFIFFALFGRDLGRLFGLQGRDAVQTFYTLGLITGAGVMVLNAARPLISWLQIAYSPQKVLGLIFLPAAVLAAVLYSVGARTHGIEGVAVAAGLTYAALAVIATVLYWRVAPTQHRKSVGVDA